MKLIREIKSKEGEIHFRRYLIWETRWFNIFLHNILKADQDKHCHDHPWNFWSLVLLGGYKEVDDKGAYRFRWPGSFKYTPAEGAYHKIAQNGGSTWSLIFAGPRTRDDWGYMTEEGWVNHRQYRKLKGEGHWDES